MNARDIGLLLNSIRNASFSNPNGFYYWKNAGKDELDDLVRKHLSSPDDRERQVIRFILRQNGFTNILDIGCGPATELEGYISSDINIQYVGVDRSDYMLHLARLKHPNADFVQADLSQLPFDDKNFDVVLLKHVLEHLPGYEAAVREGLRVSRKALIIDLFHTLLPMDLFIWNRRGYWDNWYGRKRFERFLDGLPIEGYERMTTIGNSLQTAEIYVVRKLF